MLKSNPRGAALAAIITKNFDQCLNNLSYFAKIKTARRDFDFVSNKKIRSIFKK